MVLSIDRLQQGLLQCQLSDWDDQREWIKLCLRVSGGSIKYDQVTNHDHMVKLLEQFMI